MSTEAERQEWAASPHHPRRRRPTRPGEATAQLTLEQALDIVHQWLGTASIGGRAATNWLATDELAMRVLRKWSNGIGWEIMWESIHRELQREYSLDIRDASIIAAAIWLQSRKGKPE